MFDKRVKEPCPFCGTAPKDISVEKLSKIYAFIRCTNCGVTLKGQSKQEVIDKWNFRA